MDSTDRLNELIAKEHALKIFETRNKAFRIIYDTVMQVEGAGEQEIYSVLTKNMRLICNAQFSAFASYDYDLQRMKLEAISIEGLENDPDISAVKCTSLKIAPDDLEHFKEGKISKCEDHSKCLVELFSYCINSFYVPQKHAECYKTSFIRENELLAVGMIQLKPGDRLKLKDLVETYLNMAGMILQRVNAMKALKKSEESFRTIFETARDSVYIKDVFGRYTKINPAMEKLYGIPVSNFEGKTDEDLFGKEVAGKIWEVDSRVLEGNSVEVEAEKEINNSLITLNIIKVPMFDNSGKIMGICSIARDITERKAIEQELIDKNRELNDFTYRVSHDLKSPINLIKGFALEIRDNPSLFGKYFKRIIEQADGLLDFINSLLKLSRAGRVIGHKENIDMEILVKKIFYPAKPPDINAELTLDLPLEYITGDSGSMDQVFSNLIHNSIRYRDPDKEILKISVHCREENGKAVISFKDNGMGIDEGCIDRVFSAGFTGSGGKGTGFGLAIVKKIICAHSGTIIFKSDGKGKGTEFIITLPLTE